MRKGAIWKSESRYLTDEGTGDTIRQVTNHPSIHHHPFFFVPAYDDLMARLFFISHRTGSPQIFAEERSTGNLVQLTDRPDIAEWSIYPAHNGDFVYFTAGTAGCRVNTETLKEEELCSFGDISMREKGMVGAAMGTTALSACDRWWAVPVKAGDLSRFVVIDTLSGEFDVILERDTIGHPAFCPDDATLIRYAGPLTDRVWVVRRDGLENRRLYTRDAEAGEWITHETWIPGRREVAFVDWPKGVRAVSVETGEVRRVTSFNAWHAVCNRNGSRMVADTNFPDIGLQLFDPLDGVGEPRCICHPKSSSVGAHWNGPFPYDNGPIKVFAPQHTHPHPSFSPDGKYVVYTSDVTGHSQVYELSL